MAFALAAGSRLNLTQRRWLFGYGSLISERSRKRTCAALSGVAFPVVVRGIARGWNLSVALDSTRPNPKVSGAQTLSVIEATPEARCNGVVFAVTDSEWECFAERERNYHPMTIHWSNIYALDKRGTTIANTAARSGESLCCYLQQTPISSPSADYPILQTYLDVALAGCAAVSNDFVDEFLHTTDAWPATIAAYLDDRQSPAYPRHCAIASANRSEWDQWMNSRQPTAIACRRPAPTI